MMEAGHVAQIQKSLEDYALVAGVDANYLNDDGDMVAETSICEGAEFCRIVKACPEGARLCAQSHAQAAQNAHNFGDPYIARCHMGLVILSAPVIRASRKHCVSAFPAMMWDWDDVAVDELMSRLESLAAPQGAALAASRKIKVLSSKQVQASANLLDAVARCFSDGDVSEIGNRQSLNRQQMHMADVIIEKKRAEIESGDRYEPPYPIQLEGELISKVRLGDRSGARGILNELLGYIFYRNSGNLDIMKARILELVVIISRAAVESGAGLEKLLGLNYNSILELSHITKYESICLWVVKTLDAFMDTIYDTRSVKSASFISPALDFIRTNYAQPLSLDTVAKQIHISSYYLSHLFKDELGITFVEYLTRVRIEEAKQLLKRTALPVNAVAGEVGYDDSSYFCKVFKKVTGTTPHKYRRGV